MANHASSKKRIRRNDRRAVVNGARRGRIRTFLKKVELALAAGEPDSAKAALQTAQPELMRGIAKGLYHKNTVARKMSRLTQRIQKLAASK
jgi:small subunit ribosomal protein S20